MDRHGEDNQHPQLRLDSSIHSSSSEARGHDIRFSSQNSVEVPPTLRPIHTIPVSLPAHPSLQRDMSAPGQSIISVPTFNESPIDEQSSTIGLLPPRHDSKRRYSPPISDTQQHITTMPRVIEPVMLRPPSMRAISARPVRDDYFVEDERQRPGEHGSGVDSWNEKSSIKVECTVRERLEPTLKHAKAELIIYRAKAKRTGWSVNAAISAQILFGALTTGISAATTGRQSSIATSILGGLSTMAASYLAKARGSGEPEASCLRCRELEQFERDCEAFILDYGNSTSRVFDDRIAKFRRRFEEIMGNDPSDGVGHSPDPVKGYADRKRPVLPV